MKLGLMRLGLQYLKDTKAYQEAFEEGRRRGKLKGKLETVPKFLALGLTVEQIAQALDLPVEEVRKLADSETSETRFF